MGIPADPKTTRPVPESLWRDAPEYFSRFIPRIHRDAVATDDATIQCRIDIMGKGAPFQVVGNLCLHAGNLIALTMPDCLPERLAASAYLIEAGFVYDGIKNAEMDGAAGEAAAEIDMEEFTKSKSSYEISLRNKQVLSKMAVQVMKFDRQLGDNLIAGWATWKKGEDKILPKTHGRVYQTLEEYLPDRFDDIGWPMVINLLHWGTGVVLDEKTAKELAPILEPIHHVVTLTNDYFSWEKEIAEHIELNESTPLITAVAFYMQWDNSTAEEAKASVKAKIEELEEKYIDLKEAYIARHGKKTPEAALRWFDIMEAVVAGNLIWSNFTPRYHRGTDLKADEYEEYYARRLSEGAEFFESCTESDDFIPDPKKIAVKPRRSPRQSRQSSREPAKTNGVSKKRKPAIKAVEKKRCAAADTEIATTQKKRKVNGSSHRANGKDLKHIDYREPRLPDLPEKVVNEPFEYIESLPSKGVRSLVLEALNCWYHVPEKQMKQIDNIIHLLHNASLMIDDIQDDTELRRGNPATHMKFGIGQTINSAYFQCIEALHKAHQASVDFFNIVLDEFRTGHIGQSLDLYWTYETVIPTEKEYLQMVDAKTSSLFRLCSRLLRSAATANGDLELEDMATLFGRYFQIRDDHKNLISQEYTDQKGFASDLDEGKYSLPIIHALQEPDSPLTKKLLQRRQPEGLSIKSKKWILNRLSEKGSLEYTSKQIGLLRGTIDDSLADLEKETGSINWMLRRILYQLGE